MITAARLGPDWQPGPSLTSDRDTSSATSARRAAAIIPFYMVGEHRMRRFQVVAALSGLAALTAITTIGRAQDTGGSVPDFDKKRGGNEKMHRLANVPAHSGNWKAADVELEQDRN